ncbi:hypothetical protein [Phenylobacterium soli]|uniref:Uncharacterized protein n=1 Tax=Phenylobacterium soli TaxID=2170551 RepID=A0A328AJX5_9CAUL|nr:hypothetical protein [Phenylobacterium soli]RAK54366.1 hypothetical protein DJ017_07445 [Phenylobacterium soli]
MRHYQLFPFSSEGRLLDAVEVDVDNDVRAIHRAIDGEFPNGCELWEGFRFLGRFHGPAASVVAAEAPSGPARELVH